MELTLEAVDVEVLNTRRGVVVGVAVVLDVIVGILPMVTVAGGLNTRKGVVSVVVVVVGTLIVEVVGVLNTRKGVVRVVTLVMVVLVVSVKVIETVVVFFLGPGPLFVTVFVVVAVIVVVTTFLTTHVVVSVVVLELKPSQAQPVQSQPNSFSSCVQT